MEIRQYRRGGFTLLELMLVLGILAMLAVFVLPAIIGQAADAKKQAAAAMVGRSGTIASNIKQFYIKFNRYPEKLVDLYEKPDYLDEDDEWFRFVDSPEFVDPWGNELIYEVPGEVEEDAFDLCSMGPDLKAGTEDDICNYKKED